MSDRVIERDMVVQLSYVLRDAQGTVIDSSESAEPMEYLHGRGSIIPGLERQLDGKAIGAMVTAVIPPAEGYGIRNEDLVEKVPREHFPPDQVVEPGMHFAAQTPEGEVRVVITDVDDEHVIVDGNHPLAGVELHFEVKVLSIRPATNHEIDFARDAEAAV